MEASKVLASTAKATSYNMVLQLMIRMMTFLLNAVVLRFISRDLLGVVNVRLTLLYSTILFLTKEAFDRACLSRAEGRDWRHVVNLMWCTAPLAVVWSLLLSSVWLYLLETPDPALVPYYSVGVVTFAVSSCIEVLAEPLFVTGQAFLFVKLKVLSLGISQAIKVALTVALVLWLPHWGLISFSIAQIISSISYAVIYYGYFARYVTHDLKKDDDQRFPLSSLRDFFPQPVPGKPFLDGSLTHLTWSFFKQSFLKQILTEGERYVMTFFDVLSFADQGKCTYYIIYHDAISLSSSVLGVLLKIVTLIGSIILVFGYSNSFLALYIYGGETLSGGTGPTLLRWYCLYVLVIAINGTTEGFVFATMSKEQVDKYNKKMLVFSVVFLTMAWYLTRLIGSVGFILANCLNMTARIVHSIIFIHGYFAGSRYRPLLQLMPSIPVLIVLVVSLVVTAVSEVYFCYQGNLSGKAVHIGISGICLATVAAVIYLTEQRMVRLIREHAFQKKQTKES
ncbi:hypothetical protein BaRGS_00032435 [Batillaria attramentaria]|uniref:Protein RFT1 homolog n=1 Tax=Batillaria attramentaria TaxID=370345 RepID=A0ABD0JN02_9CAEN